MKEGRPFQIEFIGLPGSGKSTLAEELISNLDAKGFKILDRKGQQSTVASHYTGLTKTQRMASFVEFCEKNDALVFELSRLSLSLRPLHRAGLRRAFIFLKQCQNASLFWKEGRGENNDLDFIIHEQDLVQELWSVIYLRPFCPDRVRAIMDNMKAWLPDLIVFIDLDGPTSKQRMGNRAAKLKKFTGEIDVMVNLSTKILDASNRDTKKLGELGTEFGADFLVIDGLDTIKKSTTKILAYLEKTKALACYSTPKNL